MDYSYIVDESRLKSPETKINNKKKTSAMSKT